MHEVDDPSELAELFGRDRPAHAYGLADLEPPFWDAGEWFRLGDAAVGIVALSDDFTTAYAISPADPDRALTLTVELLDRMPSGTMITGPVGLAAAVGRCVEIEDLGLHVKYVLQDRDRLPSADAVVPLGPADHLRVAALHAKAPGEAFMLESMLEDETFVGLTDPAGSGELIAAAGTHVVSERYDVAAIGAVLVDPAHRGRGLGAIVTAGACARLAGRVSMIGLNVEAGNVAARRTYERIGFVPCHEYEEVVIRKVKRGSDPS